MKRQTCHPNTNTPALIQNMLITDDVAKQLCLGTLRTFQRNIFIIKICWHYTGDSIYLFTPMIITGGQRRVEVSNDMNYFEIEFLVVYPFLH